MGEVIEMAHFTERNLKQKAVYWGSPVSDGYGGYTFADPVEIDCRWEDMSLVNLNSRGVEAEVSSEVQVAQDLDEEGMMLLSELVDVAGDNLNDPMAAGAKIIVRFDKIPSLKANHFYRKALLGRLRTGR